MLTTVMTWTGAVLGLGVLALMAISGVIVDSAPGSEPIRSRRSQGK
ncbi:hypothetical protein [Solihabitans fulvus]|nr:hypothetical protein [Solihabitans fulvus]